MSTTTEFLRLARLPQVVRTATRVALLVGTILVMINHGPAILAGETGLQNYLQIALTYTVPYCVSTYSAVMALLSRERQAR